MGFQNWYQLEGLVGLPKYYAVSQGILFMLKSIFKTHVTITVFIYSTLTFIIIVLKVKN